MSAETSPAGEADSGNGGSEKKFRYNSKSYSDKKWLRYFVEEEGKTVHEIADHCNMDVNSILYHVRKHDIDNGHKCPECGKVNLNETGMKKHAKRAHDLNLRGEPANCKRCGDEFRKDPGSSEIFCGNECYQAYESERHAENRPTLECESCGSSFEVKPFREETARFCSPECRAREVVAGWNAKEHPTLECNQCGELYTVPPHAVDYSKYCSKECVHKSYETRYTGSGNPYWKKGTWDYYYGPNWDEQSEKCRKRDNYRCQICGKHQDDHPRALTAHHIIPRERYIDENGVFDYERGNRLENLVAVCTSCHGKWEGIPVRPTLI